MKLTSEELLKRIEDAGFWIQHSTEYQRIILDECTFLHWNKTDQWYMIDHDGLQHLVKYDFVAQFFLQVK